MKQRLLTLIICIALLQACKDTAAPTFSSFKINGTDLNMAMPTFSAGINETATFQIISNDDDALLQLIAFVDTTGLGDKERLYADGLEGTEDFTEFTLSMRSIDSLGQLYFFGEPTPVTFTLSDRNQNTTSLTVSMSAN